MSLYAQLEALPELSAEEASQAYKAILQSVEDPRELDTALRALGAKEKGINSPDFPGYPESLGGAIWENKNHPAHKAAASLSRAMREKEFLENPWEPSRQGSFAVIVSPNREHPEESTLFVIDRSPNVGEGKGFPGGLLEEFEIGEKVKNKQYHPLRELSEELAELTSDDKAHLEEKTAEIAAKLAPLSTYFEKLSSYDDPRHYIINGAGKEWSARAHPHNLTRPPQSDHEASEAYAYLQHLLNHATESKRAGHETRGASFVKISGLPSMLDKFTYPHEALGAIIAAQWEIQKVRPDFNLPRQLYENHPDILDKLLENMRKQAGETKEGMLIHIKRATAPNRGTARVQGI